MFLRIFYVRVYTVCECAEIQAWPDAQEDGIGGEDCE